jgi:hypothetical protein
MNWSARRIEARPGHRLWVEFADGSAGEVDLAEVLFGPLGLPLLDEARFAEAQIDEFGAVCWPNGFDLGPDWLYARARAAGGSSYPAGAASTSSPARDPEGS